MSTGTTSRGQRPPNNSETLSHASIPQPPIKVDISPVAAALNGVLRETYLAQMATVEQQRELVRYMRGLNGWLEQDTQERQAELQGLNMRIEELRNLLLGRGAPPAFPEPQPFPGFPRRE